MQPTPWRNLEPATPAHGYHGGGARHEACPLPRRSSPRRLWRRDQHQHEREPGCHRRYVYPPRRRSELPRRSWDLRLVPEHPSVRRRAALPCGLVLPPAAFRRRQWVRRRGLGGLRLPRGIRRRLRDADRRASRSSAAAHHMRGDPRELLALGSLRLPGAGRAGEVLDQRSSCEPLRLRQRHSLRRVLA